MAICGIDSSYYLVGKLPVWVTFERTKLANCLVRAYKNRNKVELLSLSNILMLQDFLERLANVHF